MTLLTDLSLILFAVGMASGLYSLTGYSPSTDKAMYFSYIALISSIIMINLMP